MTTKHTPAPWHINGLETIKTTIHAHRGHVATVSAGTMLEVSPDEQEANARLIAASPRMLEALEAAYACLQNLHQLQRWDKQEGDEYDEAIDAENACLNAIIQAKGEQ